ncbi:MAG TPA: 3-isopropylmalate dehydratase small subunit [Hyphomicrobiaceae bacterium]|nr:3-isopropylmalate dehydratase small subunit [Hyphomicrobiaceae bacterium]
MRPFTALRARACPFPYANVDTDQLIPARFMRRPRADGYGPFLLHDLRRRADGELDPDFPINAEAYAGAEILVARRNFGCGSSREAAVYALADSGFRAVIAPSFGDIFSSSAVKNGLLPARVSDAEAETLIAALIAGNAGICTIDLPTQTLEAGDATIAFSIDPMWKLQLLNGWDDIDLTLNEAQAIAAFRTRDEKARPWALPRRAP